MQIGSCDTDFDKCKALLNNSKNSATALIKAREVFTRANLEQVDIQTATNWLKLFLLHFDQLSTLEINSLINDFEAVFKEKKVSIIFLEELIDDCERLGNESSIFLVKRACSLFTHENVENLNRDVAVRWLNQFENHSISQEVLVGIGKVFHEVFLLKKDDVKDKLVKIICLYNRVHPLPLFLLLKYKFFQKNLKDEFQYFRLDKTPMVVVQVFEKYFYDKKLDEGICTKDSQLLVHLLDIARRFEDELLIDQCIEKMRLFNPGDYIKVASLASIQGEKAMKQSKFKEAKQFFEIAIKERDSDYLSHKALGDIATRNKCFIEAFKYYEKALEYAPFKPEFYFLQAQALCNHVKKCDLEINDLCAKIFRLIKEINFNENIEKKLKLFLDVLKGFLKENEFKCDIKTDAILLKEHLIELRGQLLGLNSDNKQKFLSQAETLLEKTGIEKNTDLYFSESAWMILKVEILIAQGDLQNANEYLIKIKKMLMQNSANFSISEQVIFLVNYSKYYTLKNQKDKALESLRQALELDESNDEVKRSLILMGDQKFLQQADEFIKKNEHDNELNFMYAQFLFQNHQLEATNAHLLRSDQYSASVNYYRGEISERDTYFEKALKIALVDPPPLTICLKIAHYFLDMKNDDMLDMLIQIFTQVNFLENRPWEISEILFQLAERIKNEEIKDIVLTRALEFQSQGQLGPLKDESFQKKLNITASELENALIDNNCKALKKLHNKLTIMHELFPEEFSILEMLLKIKFKEKKDELLYF